METITKPDYGRVLKWMNGAIKVQEMYPHGHPATLQATEKSFHALQEIFKNIDYLTISQVKDRIIINGTFIEGASLPERLLEEFKNENINSLTFNKNLNPEELSNFLSFFVKSFNKDSLPTSLPAFLKENGIKSITIDQLRYELVSEEEVVVKAEALEGVELKAQISAIIKDNPDLVLDIIFNKPVKKEIVVEKFGSEINLSQLTEGIEKQLKELSDDQVLSILVSGLNEKLPTVDSPDPNSTQNEMVDLVLKLLQNSEKRKLLPEVKKMLSERGIVKKEHLDFLFDEKWLQSQTVLDEVLKMIEKLGTEEVDFERFMFLWHRVISSEDSKIKLYAIDKLLFKLDSESVQTGSLAVVALKEALSHFVSEKMEFEFSYVKDRLYDKIKDQLMSPRIFKNYTKLLKDIFLEMIKLEEFKEIHEILLEYNVHLSTEMSYPQEVRNVALNFIHEVSDVTTLAILTSHIKEGTPSPNIKLVEEILESLDKDKVAEKLLEIFTVDDRVARMSALRVLSRLGKSSVSALLTLLSTPHTYIREKGSELLVNEQWYKVRNVIFVLGNIPSVESVQTLLKLNQDPDLRVRMEVIKALERIGGPESVRALLTFLSDKEDEIRRNAITSLSRLGDKSCLLSLIEHFRHNRKDKLITLNAISKIGGDEPTDSGESSRTIKDYEEGRTIEDSDRADAHLSGRSRTIKFLLDVLWEKELGMKNLHPKERDEIRISTLNILGKIGSPELVSEIEKFIRQNRKSLRGLLAKDRLIESANRALKMIRSKYSKSLPDTIGWYGKK
jgi:HEAT repeat protein